MIFKQVDEILSGRKTQTRRVANRSEYQVQPMSNGPEYGVYYRVHGTDWRLQWGEGRTYAVVPKRGQRTVFWRQTEGGEIETTRDRADLKHWTKKALTGAGWTELRIRITAIRQERLQDITEADALAEGVESVEAYRALWDSINGKTKGADWNSNSLCWVLTFEVVKP